MLPAASNRPYRGGKSQLYEGGIRVPLIIRCAGITKAGSLSDFPVISTDLYTTMLDMAGIPLRPEQHLDGLSLTPLLKGEKKLNRMNLFWHYPQYQTLPPHSAIRAGNWKLIYHYESNTNELFNLLSDPSEANNLAEKEPELAEKLQKILHDHLLTIGAQFPQPNPVYKPGVPWRQGSRAGSFDKDYEAAQETDPRQYVTDPSLDYGMNQRSE